MYSRYIFHLVESRLVRIFFFFIYLFTLYIFFVAHKQMTFGYMEIDYIFQRKKSTLLGINNVCNNLGCFDL